MIILNPNKALQKKALVTSITEVSHIKIWHTNVVEKWQHAAAGGPRSLCCQVQGIYLFYGEIAILSKEIL